MYTALAIQALIDARLILNPQDVKLKPEYVNLVTYIEERCRKTLAETRKKDRLREFLWSLFWVVVGALMGIFLQRLVG